MRALKKIIYLTGCLSSISFGRAILVQTFPGPDGQSATTRFEQSTNEELRRLSDYGDEGKSCYKDRIPLGARATRLDILEVRQSAMEILLTMARNIQFSGEGRGFLQKIKINDEGVIDIEVNIVNDPAHGDYRVSAIVPPCT